MSNDNVYVTVVFFWFSIYGVDRYGLRAVKLWVLEFDDAEAIALKLES